MNNKLNLNIPSNITSQSTSFFKSLHDLEYTVDYTICEKLDKIFLSKALINIGFL